VQNSNLTRLADSMEQGQLTTEVERNIEGSVSLSLTLNLSVLSLLAITRGSGYRAFVGEGIKAWSLLNIKKPTQCHTTTKTVRNYLNDCYILSSYCDVTDKDDRSKEQK
jgi:hypothetical protein